MNAPAEKDGKETEVTGNPRRRRLSKLLGVSILLAVFGLAVTTVHFIWPSPLMFTLFMTVGQGSFAAGIVLYLVVIFGDLRRKGVL